MGKYIYSTLTASQKYPIWIRTPGRDIPRIQSYVLIHGGANLPSKVLVTPRGVVTSISDDEFERLIQCPGFQQHVDNGFLVVEDREYDPDSVAENMEPKDFSAPMVPEDFEADGVKPPTLATDEPSEPDLSRVSATQRPTQAATRTSEEKTEAENVKAAEAKAAAKKQARAEKKAAKKLAAETSVDAIEPSPRMRRGRPPQSDA